MSEHPRAPRFAFCNTVLAAVFLLTSSFGSTGCHQKKAASPPDPGRDGFAHPRELVTGEDGLVRRNGETNPYTGAAIVRDRDWNLRSFAYYQKGRLHGPEMRFWENGTPRRNFDYEAGEKTRHREWFANGNPKTDAMMRKGEAHGHHQTWFEDGSPRWSGRFVENLQWDGPIVDYAPDGKLMWRAVFDHGRFVSGIYPESEQEKLIEAGMLKPQDAMYPRQPLPEKGQ